MDELTRAEHLESSKERSKDAASGVVMWVTFVNDLSKHSELSNHIAIELGTQILSIDGFETRAVKEFIDGFN